MCFNLFNSCFPSTSNKIKKKNTENNKNKNRNSQTSSSNNKQKSESNISITTNLISNQDINKTKNLAKDLADSVNSINSLSKNTSSATKPQFSILKIQSNFLSKEKLADFEENYFHGIDNNFSKYLIKENKPLKNTSNSKPTPNILLNNNFNNNLETKKILPSSSPSISSSSSPTPSISKYITNSPRMSNTTNTGSQKPQFNIPDLSPFPSSNQTDLLAASPSGLNNRPTIVLNRAKNGPQMDFKIDSFNTKKKVYEFDNDGLLAKELDQNLKDLRLDEKKSSSSSGTSSNNNANKNSNSSRNNQKTKGGKIHIKKDQVYEFVESDFSNLGQIGHGEFGTVEKVIHKPSHTYMAMKRLLPTVGNQREREKTLKELDFVLECQENEFVVKFYGVKFNNEPADCLICMELMDTSLEKFYKFVYEVKHEEIPEEILGKIVFSTISALNYLKEKHSIIHRDVKPSNILVNRQGSIKMCDFGISGKLVDSIAASRDAGCQLYMAVNISLNF
jgi:hypothetical protein